MTKCKIDKWRNIFDSDRFRFSILINSIEELKSFENCTQVTSYGASSVRRSANYEPNNTITIHAKRSISFNFSFRCEKVIGYFGECSHSFAPDDLLQCIYMTICIPHRPLFEMEGVPINTTTFRGRIAFVPLVFESAARRSA